MSLLYALGIESTAHTFACSVVSDDGRILVDERVRFTPEKGKGIHPREAANFFVENASKVVENAIRKSGISLDEISLVAFAQGPGLGPCLRVGATIARTLSLSLNVPIIGVHHGIAHIEIGKLLTGMHDPLTVIVSGGHTCVVAHNAGRYRIYGETLDITLGNLFDVFVRELDLSRKIPACKMGSIVEELAKNGKTMVEELPYIVKGNDVSYSGLLTRAIEMAREGKYSIEDICFSLQEIAFSMLCEVTERALTQLRKKEVLLTGGVCANKRLQEMMRDMVSIHNVKIAVVPSEYSADNAAMIAWTGILAYKAGVKMDIEDTFIRPRWRLDEVDTPWINNIGGSRGGNL